jgi:hypothetical protein
MLSEFWIIGGLGGAGSLIALIGAGVQTVKLAQVQSPVDRMLKDAYDGVVNEPVPNRLMVLVQSLGGDSNDRNNSEDSTRT